MEIDSNSCGTTQWFYFGITNTKAKRTYKFHILNFKKDKSQFQEGMKPFVFSEIGSRRSGKDDDWKRGCFDVKYYPTHCFTKIDINMFEKCDGKNTLEFSYTPEFNNDIVYFAYSIPYTSVTLKNDMKLWKKSITEKKKYILKKQL